MAQLLLFFRQDHGALVAPLPRDDFSHAALTAVNLLANFDATTTLQLQQVCQRNSGADRRLQWHSVFRRLQFLEDTRFLFGFSEEGWAGPSACAGKYDDLLRAQFGYRREHGAIDFADRR